MAKSRRQHLSRSIDLVWIHDIRAFAHDATVDPETRDVTQVAQFSEFCFWATQTSANDSSELYIGLSHSSKLHISNGQGTRTLATNANSFTVTPGFLIYTTTAHVAHFAPLGELEKILATSDVALPEFETRRVERGSRIVTAVPSNMSLVLQMPRGNLETINPRPLVMEIVKQDIDRFVSAFSFRRRSKVKAAPHSGNYGKAFTACRKHRIDLNVFVEHNREAFLQGIPSFLEQVSDVDYINLFLTSLGYVRDHDVLLPVVGANCAISQGSLPDDLVAQICNKIRDELEQKDLKKYMNSILTAHVVKRPPDHEAGLAALLRLRGAFVGT